MCSVCLETRLLLFDLRAQLPPSTLFGRDLMAGVVFFLLKTNPPTAVARESFMKDGRCNLRTGAAELRVRRAKNMTLHHAIDWFFVADSRAVAVGVFAFRSFT